MGKQPRGPPRIPRRDIRDSRKHSKNAAFLIFFFGGNRFSNLWASRGRSYYQNPSRKLPGYRTLLLDEFQHGIFHMDPFRVDYYSFLDLQNGPKLSPGPRTDVFLGSASWDPVFLGAAFCDPCFGLLGTLRS